MTLTPGLCSVTLRGLGAEAVIGHAAANGLEGIEWGGDIHVPVGDLRRAREVAERTAQAGLRCLSYGSYYVAGDPGFPVTLETAVALGVPRIRIWAGACGSGEARAHDWERVVDSTRRNATLAAEAGVRLAFECHSDTLTDTPDATARLLGEVDPLTVGAYWQASPGETRALSLAGLTALGHRLMGVHAYTLTRRGERLPLSAGGRLWNLVFNHLRSRSGDVDVMLEFVRHDHLEALAMDAATLTSWCRSST